MCYIVYRKRKEIKNMKWKVWGYAKDTPLIIVEANSSDEALKIARKFNKDYNITQVYEY